jgi:hypothetical protein
MSSEVMIGVGSKFSSFFFSFFFSAGANPFWAHATQPFFGFWPSFYGLPLMMKSLNESYETVETTHTCGETKQKKCCKMPLSTQKEGG